MHVVTPGTYEYVTLHANRDFPDGIKLRILQWGEAVLMGWSPCNCRGLSEWKREAK